MDFYSLCLGVASGEKVRSTQYGVPATRANPELTLPKYFLVPIGTQYSGYSVRSANYQGQSRINSAPICFLLITPYSVLRTSSTTPPYVLATHDSVPRTQYSVLLPP